MKTTVLISRLVLGFLYLVFGLDYFLHFIPYQPPQHPGAAGLFKAGLLAAGYFYPMQKAIQIAGGLSLLINRYAPLSAVVLFPISLNVFLFHTILAPSAWPMGVLLLLPNLLLGLGYREYYRGLFTAKPMIGIIQEAQKR
jgi:putative oxidoreductase